MRNKLIFLMTSLLVLISFALPNMNDSVFAALKLADGEYELPVTVLQGDKDEPSKTNDYIDPKVKLIVKSGKYKVQMTIKNSDWWQYFKVNGSDVSIISEDQANNTRLVEFPVKNLDEIVPAKIHIIVPDIDYDNHYDIRLKFDTSNLPIESIDSEENKSKDSTENRSESEKEDSTIAADDNSDSKNQQKEENPPTGDQTPLILLMVLMMGSAIFLVRKTVIN